MKNFPEPYQLLVAYQMLHSHIDIGPKPPKAPQKRRIKEAMHRAIRNLGTFLVRLGYKMEQVGRTSHELVIQPDKAPSRRP